MSVRVLLVESDDSTRQIIAALLRKCGYRVSAVSDGLKAWERLKEKSHNVDIVLTEMDLPSISGFALLTMIMDHNTCKNVPVIMMSSHDSISMVFKCMLKGAADFLVKPIRKNELRNLWQHVWRRHILNGQQGKIHEHQDENITKKKMDGNSREYIDCMQENQECSEKGSDAQSSCTRSDMEVESTCPHMLDNNQHKSTGIHVTYAIAVQTDDKHIEYDGVLLTHESEAEDKSSMTGRKVIQTPLNGSCNLNEPRPKQDHTYAVTEDLNEDKPCKEVVDLIGAIDNQPQYRYVQRNVNTISDASDILRNEKDVEYESRSAHLELSLRRYQRSSCDRSENEEWNTLNHSNSSAFSLYNSRIVVPASPTPRNSDSGQKEHSTTAKTLAGQDSGNPSDAPCCNDSAQKMHAEDTNLVGLEFGSQEGNIVHYSPVRVIPFPAPFRGMPFDNWSAGYGTVSQPVYYPQAAHPFWGTVPPMWHEAVHTNSPLPTCPKDINCVENHQQDDQTPQNVIQHPERKNEQDKVQSDGPRHVSSFTGESGCSSIRNVTSSHLNIIGSGSLSGQSEGNIVAASISDANATSEHAEGQFTHAGIKPTAFHCLNQREAALNKFRLKRKERCFEKKVRYHSRKRLAEQRPRVKGQFIRQVLPDS